MNITQGKGQLLELERTPEGWLVSGITTDEQDLKAEKDGKGGFFKVLGPVVYPSTVPMFLVRCWNQLEDESETEEHVQKQMDLMAQWIGKTDTSAPQGLEY